MAKLNKNLITLARQAGGSFKTVSDRMKIADRFAERLLKLNVQIRDIKNIKTGHIELYMKSRLSEEISRRTLQNEMSAIRALLRVAGKTFMANRGADSDETVSTAELLSVLDQISASPASDTAMPNDTVTEVTQGNSSPGKAFLNWLKASILDSSVSVNENDSFVHILAQFVFIVSPECFYKYLSLNTNEALDKSELQKSFEALDVHYSRNGKGLWHYHKYDTPDKSGRYTKMSGYMLSADIIYRKGSCPPDSVWLARRN